MNNSDAGWSAIADARKGYNFYKNSGFSKAQLTTPAGIDHFEYDEGAILKTTLDKYYK